MTMSFKHILLVSIFLQICSATIYYGVRTYDYDEGPLFGSIYSFNSQSAAFRFFANFSFHIDDKETYLYFFESGPVVSVNQTIFFPIQCGTAFQRLMLYSYDMSKKRSHQSSWILHDGFIHFLHYDRKRNRLFGLRDYSTFTLILEEYSLTNLSVVKEYTRQNGNDYAFPYAGCSIYDPEENWLVQIRTRFDNPSVNAYYVKMDLNLIGNRTDLVIDFHLLPNIHNLCSMTYDIPSKTALVTWQHGSIELDLFMMYMNPYTAEFRNQTLLLEHRTGYDVESVEAIYNEKTSEILFLVLRRSENDDVDDEKWMFLVQFHTMKIIQKTKVNQIDDLDMWEFVLL